MVKRQKLKILFVDDSKWLKELFKIFKKYGHFEIDNYDLQYDFLLSYTEVLGNKKKYDMALVDWDLGVCENGRHYGDEVLDIVDADYKCIVSSYKIEYDKHDVYKKQPDANFYINLIKDNI